MGEERAETYVRLLAEVELRRASDQLRGQDAAAGTGDQTAPGISPFALTEITMWKVIRAGRILVAAGALDQDCLDRLAADLSAAIYARSMHWPPDGSSTDLEINGAGPQQLPYGQLWAVDDQGTRYAVRFEGGMGGTASWPGIARLSPMPPRRARQLDLVGDGTRLIRLPLGRPAARGRAALPTQEPAAIPPGERLLILEADRILASGDARGPVQGPDLGEIITVLTQAGAIAADSPLSGVVPARRTPRRPRARSP